MEDEPDDYELEDLSGDLLGPGDEEPDVLTLNLLSAVSLFDGIDIPRGVLGRTKNIFERAEMLKGYVLSSVSTPDKIFSKISKATVDNELIKLNWFQVAKRLKSEDVLPAYDIRIEDNQNFIDELSKTPEYQRRPWEKQGNYWIASKSFEPYEHSTISGIRLGMHTDPENYASKLTAHIAYRRNAFTEDIDELLHLVDLKNLVENYPLMGDDCPSKIYKLDGGGTGRIYEVPPLGSVKIEMTSEGVFIASIMNEEFKEGTSDETKQEYLQSAVEAQMLMATDIWPQFIGQIAKTLSPDDNLPKLEFTPVINAPEKEDSLLKRFKKSQEEFAAQVPDILRDPRHIELYRAVAVPSPEITFDMVGGLDEEVKRMRRSVNKAHNPEAYIRAGLKPKATVLLAGPPGCGKTMLAEAAANQIDGIFLSARGSDLMSMWAGEAEKNVAALFDMAELLGREHKVVLFLDEIESIAPSRTGQHMMEYERKITAEFLGALNRNYPNCFIVAATNEPKHVDSAVLRSGRFNDVIMIGKPNPEGRQQIIQNWMDYYTKQADLKLFEDDLDMQAIVRTSNELSGADLKTIVESVIGDEVDDAIEEDRDYRPISTLVILRQINQHREKEQTRIGAYL